MGAGRIDLERARREAKQRVKDARAQGEAVKLADAQLAVARELGEASWPRLVHRAEAEAVAREDRARRLVQEATDGRRDHAEALLALDADVGRDGLDAALVLGEADRVGATLARDPGAASRPTGARDWLPLLYVTHTAFLGGERTDGLVECARALLDAGADPDSSWQHPEFGALGALYGAAGVAHEPRITALLLEAGANPDDDESVYHATETSDHTCLRLLLDAGARVEGTNAFAHTLDTEDPTKVRLLLEHDAGSEVERSLLWAVYRERSPEVLRVLVDHGADINAFDEDNERTPYGLAWRMGRPDLCELLAELGARREVGPVDELIGLCFAGDREGARRVAAEHPERVERIRSEFYEALHQAAAEGRSVAVELLLDLGVPIDLPGQMGGTPLHHAAWWGHGDVVALLLERGAGPHRTNDNGSMPLAAAAHGSFHSPGPIARGGTDHRRIAELLVAAGAKVDPEMAHDAAPELAEWLADRAETDLAELDWAAHAAYLGHLSTSPLATRREVGDGFAVRTGISSNSENGVVCSRLDGDPAEIVAWMDGVPAEWLVGADTDLRERLTAAGCRPERDAVVMGAPIAALELGEPVGEPAEAAIPDWIAVAEAVGFVDPGEDARRRGELLATLVPRVRLYVARRDGRAVGMASAFTHAGTLLLLELAVRPEARRRGVGSGLLARAVRDGAAADAAHVVLGPTPESISLYRSLGFTLQPALRDRVFYLPG